MFQRFIGVDVTPLNTGKTAKEYNDILKTYYDKMTASDTAVVFDGAIPVSPNFELVQFVKKELQTMDVTHISQQDITIFSNNPDINKQFLAALEYVVLKAIQQERFQNETIRNNFITKLILWTYIYIGKLAFKQFVYPKCFYYGNITRHEVYFLIMLHKMGFDVIYANPLEDPVVWSQVDTDGLSEVVTLGGTLTVETLAEKIKNAAPIEYTESDTLAYEAYAQQTLFTGTGVYKPWQFRNGYAKSLFFNSTIHDLKNMWTEAVNVRPGFKVEGQTVTVPTFFHKVDGEYRETKDYYELVHLCSEAENTMFVTGAGLKSLIVPLAEPNDRFKIAFCRKNDNEYSEQALTELPFYRYAKYRDELEYYLLQKVNEVVKSNQLFRIEFNRNNVVDFILITLSMCDGLMRLLDNFDYTSYNPKVVVFLEKEEVIEDREMYLLGFLHALGFDVIIFSPSGLESSNVVLPDRFNVDRLDTMSYERTYDNLKKPKKGLFKLFS